MEEQEGWEEMVVKERRGKEKSRGKQRTDKMGEYEGK